jgi:hypothetical protein
MCVRPGFLVLDFRWFPHRLLLSIKIAGLNSPCVRETIRHLTDARTFSETIGLGQAQVWEKNYDVTVHQRSKSVWIAVGDYMGERLETKDSSASTALKRWQEAARYRGN